MNSKFLYNLKGIALFSTPRFFSQPFLESTLTSLLCKIDEKRLECIKTRLNYYYKENLSFVIKPICLENNSKEIERLSIATPKFVRLGELYRFRAPSSYRYDTNEYARYFPRDFAIYAGFGDVNYYFNAPSITKSRPISVSNANSILFKLDKNRHFYFPRDSVKFEDKRDILFWRGGVYQSNRAEFFTRFFTHPLCDIGHTGSKHCSQQWAKPKISVSAHFPYKFLLSLEGNDVASNLKWIMHSNSLCFSTKPKYETWFMEGLLKADYHFVCIRDDFSDVEEKIEFFTRHPNDAKEIIHNAQKFCAQFLDSTMEDLLCLLVLRKYFYLSGQMHASKQELELFGI
ncbi:glycosyl transferase family 90 [Helicobacter sp. 23-1048]